MKNYKEIKEYTYSGDHFKIIPRLDIIPDFEPGDPISIRAFLDTLPPKEDIFHHEPHRISNILINSVVVRYDKDGAPLKTKDMFPLLDILHDDIENTFSEPWVVANTIFFHDEYTVSTSCLSTTGSLGTLGVKCVKASLKEIQHVCKELGDHVYKRDGGSIAITESKCSTILYTTKMVGYTIDLEGIYSAALKLSPGGVTRNKRINNVIIYPLRSVHSDGKCNKLSVSINKTGGVNFLGVKTTRSYEYLLEFCQRFMPRFIHPIPSFDLKAYHMSRAASNQVDMNKKIRKRKRTIDTYMERYRTRALRTIIWKKRRHERLTDDDIDSLVKATPNMLDVATMEVTKKGRKELKGTRPVRVTYPAASKVRREAKRRSTETPWFYIERERLEL